MPINLSSRMEALSTAELYKIEVLIIYFPDGRYCIYHMICEVMKHPVRSHNRQFQKCRSILHLGNFQILLGVLSYERFEHKISNIRSCKGKALMEYASIFREIAEKSLLGIYVIQDGIFRYVNPRLAQIFGYNLEELTEQKGPVDLVSPADWYIVEENLRKRLSGKAMSIRYEFRGRKKDGGLIHAEAEGFLTTWQDRPAVAGTLVDISGRKKAEKVIQRQRDFLQDIIESITAPFYVIDANDYSIVMSNSASGFRGLAGSKLCYALTHNREKPCHSSGYPCPLETVRKTGKATTVEHIHSDSDGNARIFEIHGYPIADGKGVVTRMAEYCLDITERKQVEEEREHLIEQLQTAISKIKALEGLLSICSYCKKIRDDNGHWSQVEDYIRKHSEAEFSHGLCPDCAKKLYPKYFDNGGKENL
jgi:PAS domain S-box-containing protein